MNSNHTHAIDLAIYEKAYHANPIVKKIFDHEASLLSKRHEQTVQWVERNCCTRREGRPAAIRALKLLDEIGMGNYFRGHGNRDSMIVWNTTAQTIIENVVSASRVNPNGSR